MRRPRVHRLYEPFRRPKAPPVPHTTLESLASGMATICPSKLEAGLPTTVLA